MHRITLSSLVGLSVLALSVTLVEANGEPSAEGSPTAATQTVYDILIKTAIPVADDCIATYNLKKSKTQLPFETSATTRAMLQGQAARMAYDKANQSDIFSFVFTTENATASPSLNQFENANGALRRARQLNQYLPQGTINVDTDPVLELVGDYSCKFNLSSKSSWGGGLLQKGTLEINAELETQGQLADDRGLAWLGGRYHSRFDPTTASRRLAYAVWSWALANKELASGNPDLWLLTDADLLAVTLYSKSWRTAALNTSLEVKPGVMALESDEKIELERKFQSTLGNWQLYYLTQDSSTSAVTDFSQIGSVATNIDKIWTFAATRSYFSTNPSDLYLSESTTSRHRIFVPELPEKLCRKELWTAKALSFGASAGASDGDTSSTEELTTLLATIEDAKLETEPGPAPASGVPLNGCTFTIAVEAKSTADFELIWPNDSSGALKLNLVLQSTNALTFESQSDASSPKIVHARIPASLTLLKSDLPSIRWESKDALPAIISDTGLQNLMKWDTSFSITTSPSSKLNKSGNGPNFYDKGQLVQTTQLSCEGKYTESVQISSAWAASDAFNLTLVKDLPDGAIRKPGGSRQYCKTSLLVELSVGEGKDSRKIRRNLTFGLYYPETYVPSTTGAGG